MNGKRRAGHVNSPELSTPDPPQKRIRKRNDVSELPTQFELVACFGICMSCTCNSSARITEMPIAVTMKVMHAACIHSRNNMLSTVIDCIR